MKILFVHPDLGIGGAERLVVDAAVALRDKNHDVRIFTAHHDRTHCFKETADGTLSVTVVGDWLPRTICGKFYALCAYIRVLYVALYVIACNNVAYDVAFCDQIPISVPILKLRVNKVAFYCHFPDLLLCQPGGFLKRLYRMPINWIEEKCVNYADIIFVNSVFTRTIFKKTFASIKRETRVLYPSINTNAYDGKCDQIQSSRGGTAVFLSLNRYERKKNVALAIDALACMKSLASAHDWEKISLVIAGGYDPNLPENREYYEELKQRKDDLKLGDKVIFLISPSDDEKIDLMLNCVSVVYTPDQEHFGIVPLEAMYCGKPVIAANSGGPKETVVDGETGFLRSPVPEDFAKAMLEIYENQELARSMGAKSRKRFDENFSFESFSRKLNNALIDE